MFPARPDLRIASQDHGTAEDLGATPSRRRSLHLLDHEHDAVAVALRRFKTIPYLIEQIGNIDDRQWVGALDLEPLARPQGFQRLAGLERRQRAFQPRQVELRHHGDSSCPTRRGIVNRRQGVRIITRKPAARP